jgi:hypothetical protein
MLVGYSSMPHFGDDRGREFTISGAEWHELSHHNAARATHHRLQAEALASGFDVHQVESSIVTPKTRRVDRYLEHVRQSIGNFQRLHAHYKQERWSRWRTYRCEQKTLHELSMRVKGNPRAKREDVVVAYGKAAWPTMRGKRPVPAKRLRKHLSRYVTVVLVDEYRTSRECSGCWEKRWLKKKKRGKKKKWKKKKRVGSVEATAQVDSGVVSETREEDEGGGGHLDLERAEASRRR